MLKFLVLAVAAYVLYKMFANDIFKRKKAADAEEKARTAERVAAGEMVKDPECGTYVDRESSISVRNGDQRYHFCSYECRDKFLHRLETGSAELPHEESDK